MRKLPLAILLVSMGLAFPINAIAGGCAPGEPCWEDPPKKIMKPRPAPAVVAPAPIPEEVQEAPTPAPVAMKEKDGGLVLGLSAGVNVLTFKCEDTHVAPALYLDAGHDDLPLNMRLGVEGVDLADSEQYKHTPESEWFQEEPNFTLIRLPLSLEYVQAIGEKTQVLVGGGPDLLILSGEANDTTVGFHLGARIRQALTDSLGVSVGGGYLWGEADVRSEHYDLESAYIGTDLSYRF